jgi:hypothetical protein
MGKANIDVEEKRVELVDVDAALDYLNHEDTTLMSEVDEKKLVRKIDWMIVPLLFLCYCLQFLDKTLSMRSSFHHTGLP